jgi:hypothetical protein
MAELALDDVDRHPFACELDGMSVAQLMGSEPPPDARVDRQLSQFASRGGRGPAAASSWPVDDTEQGSGRSDTRCANQAASCSNPNWSIPASRRLSPLACYAEARVMPSSA